MNWFVISGGSHNEPIIAQTQSEISSLESEITKADTGMDIDKGNEVANLTSASKYMVAKPPCSI